MGTKKINYLDGLRGLSAASVVVGHFLAVFYPACFIGFVSHSWWDLLLFNSPLSFIYNGSYAVSIFFVLSGYVLTKSYFVKGDETILVKRIIGRYFRLLIPVAVSIILAFLLLRFNLHKIKEIVLITGANNFIDKTPLFLLPPAIKVLVKNIFWDTWVNEDPRFMYNLVLWTMPIEFKGSLLVMSCALISKKIKHKEAFIMAVASVFIISSSFNDLNIFYAGFLFGTFLAMKPIKINKWCVFMGLILSFYLGGYTCYSSQCIIVSKAYSISFHACQVAKVRIVRCL